MYLHHLLFIYLGSVASLEVKPLFHLERYHELEQEGKYPSRLLSYFITTYLELSSHDVSFYLYSILLIFLVSSKPGYLTEIEVLSFFHDQN